MGWVFWLSIALKALLALLELLDTGKVKTLTAGQGEKLDAVLKAARRLDHKAVTMGLRAAPEE